MASLEVLKGPTIGQRVPLDGDKFVIGRDPSCQVVIPSTNISRTHAQIVRVRGQYYLEDLKSRNRTYLNEVLVEERTSLQDNDRIRICECLWMFRDGAELDDEEDTSSSVEAAVSNLSSHMLLESQPAEKIKVILEISNNLSKTLELGPLLPKIVESLFTLFRQADRGFIILKDQVSNKLVPRVIRTRRPQDEDDARFSRKIVNQAMESVQALLSDDASSDVRFGTSQSIADFRIRSVMCAPLWSQDGKAFGVIQLDTQDRTKKFTQDDLSLLIGVASQASIALENAKLHLDLVARERLKRDLELAHEVQRSFLPTRPPDVPGYEFFAHYESALEVSGDYYDFVPLPGGRVAVMLGDVAGKGMAAALLMAKISADARFCVLSEPGPAQAVSRLNALLHESGLTDRFITLIAAFLDPATHELEIVNAGHPTPLVKRHASGDLEDAISTDAAGLPIGVLESFEYASTAIRLEPGDAVLVFSDGVTEAMDVKDNQLNARGIFAALQGERFTPRALGERLVKVVKHHAAGRSQHDDITLVSFGRTA